MHTYYTIKYYSLYATLSCTNNKAAMVPFVIFKLHFILFILALLDFSFVFYSNKQRKKIINASI